eukprot:COSAG01_NODE_6694_length_3540_cov_2.642255_4_plen_247_part_00
MLRLGALALAIGGGVRCGRHARVRARGRHGAGLSSSRWGTTRGPLCVHAQPSLSCPAPHPCAGCIRWEDGCNQCFVNGTTGVVIGCTVNACGAHDATDNPCCQGSESKRGTRGAPHNLHPQSVAGIPAPPALVCATHILSARCAAPGICTQFLDGRTCKNGEDCSHDDERAKTCADKLAEAEAQHLGNSAKPQVGGSAPLMGWGLLVVHRGPNFVCRARSATTMATGCRVRLRGRQDASGARPTWV